MPEIHRRVSSGASGARFGESNDPTLHLIMALFCMLHFPIDQNKIQQKEPSWLAKGKRLLLLNSCTNSSFGRQSAPQNELLVGWLASSMKWSGIKSAYERHRKLQLQNGYTENSGRSDWRLDTWTLRSDVSQCWRWSWMAHH
jgi:hypothetical protein